MHAYSAKQLYVLVHKWWKTIFRINMLLSRWLYGAFLHATARFSDFLQLQLVPDSTGVFEISHELFLRGCHRQRRDSTQMQTEKELQKFSFQLQRLTLLWQWGVVVLSHQCSKTLLQATWKNENDKEGKTIYYEMFTANTIVQWNSGLFRFKEFHVVILWRPAEWRFVTGVGSWYSIYCWQSRVWQSIETRLSYMHLLLGHLQRLYVSPFFLQTWFYVVET